MRCIRRNGLEVRGKSAGNNGTARCVNEGRFHRDAWHRLHARAEIILRREQGEVFGCADARACITDFLVGGDQWRGKVARIRMLIDAAKPVKPERRRNNSRRDAEDHRPTNKTEDNRVP